MPPGIPRFYARCMAEKGSNPQIPPGTAWGVGLSVGVAIGMGIGLIFAIAFGAASGGLPGTRADAAADDASGADAPVTGKRSMNGRQNPVGDVAA